MARYKMKIIQARPVIVEADTIQEAISLAIDASEWDYDCEEVMESEQKIYSQRELGER